MWIVIVVTVLFVEARHIDLQHEGSNLNYMLSNPPIRYSTFNIQPATSKKVDI